MICPGLNITTGIGLFHVHGHQDSCYARYAPSFIPGAGKEDGEILERLWGVLNRISAMARTMTLAHRTENLDANMGDSNFKKMINMGTYFPLERWTCLFETSQCPHSAKNG